MAQTGNPLLDKYNTIHQTTPFDKIQISHYEPAFEIAMQKHNDEIEDIVSNKSKPSFLNTIEALEYSGELLDNISRVFFTLLSAESNDQMMEISQRLQAQLTDHSNNINLNEGLFARVKEVYQQKENLKISGEQMRLLNNTFDSFVNRGANLSAQDKQKYRELSSRLSALSLQYGQNVLKETNAYEMLLTQASQLEGLPQNFIEAAAQKAKSSNKTGWIIDLSAPSYVPFLKYAADRELRKELYTASTSKCTSGEFNNLENVRQIANTRQEIAKLMGYDTYAQQVLRKRMAANTSNVYKLLDELLEGFRPAATKEVMDVQELANNDLKTSQEKQVMPYDWTFYSEQVKNAKFSISEEMIRPYFELENVKNGVFGLATDLFGITFKKNEKIAVYHHEVDAYEVFDKDGSLLAVLYTDFYPRAGKRAGAWMTSFKGQEMRKGKNMRPQTSIVMNFTRPTGSAPALLSFDEVETFLHEFGHALHGMFANTVYPSMSGTSVYRDFVELPSQLMENFLLEKTFLDKFAKHYQTGEVIPDHLVKKIDESSNFNAGYLCMRQLSFGYLDMAYHTIDKPLDDVLIADFERQAMDKTNILPTIASSLMSPSFGHIFSGGYAAGYYSYKWAEVLDADAYALFQEKGVYDKKTAQSFRDCILSRGGTEDPMVLYKRFRGQEPNTKALLKRSGIK
ncbi:dipeptidyl carboxypeptidase II [Bacteroidales bacterium]|nr:dipeptidyl carboxypeptidase II [Bacteroidales bacterium]